MKIQNIIALLVLTSVVFIGCKKDKSLELRDSKTATQVNEIQPSISITDEGDDDEELLDKKRKLSTIVMKSIANTPVSGAEVKLFNASYSVSGVTNVLGLADVVVPSAGNYHYQVMYKGQVVVDEDVTITNSTTRLVSVE